MTLGVIDMVAMRAFYERLGLIASSASNPDVTFFDANGIVLALFGYHALAEDAGVAAGPVPAFRGVGVAWNAVSEDEVDRIMAHAKAAAAQSRRKRIRFSGAAIPAISPTRKGICGKWRLIRSCRSTRMGTFNCHKS